MYTFTRYIYTSKHLNIFAHIHFYDIYIYIYACQGIHIHAYTYTHTLHIALRRSLGRRHIQHWSAPAVSCQKLFVFSLAIIQRWSYHAVHVESDYLSFPREPYSDGYTLLITWKSGMPLALGASVLICTTFHFLVILQRWLYHAGRISIFLVQNISVWCMHRP